MEGLTANCWYAITVDGDVLAHLKTDGTGRFLPAKTYANDPNAWTLEAKGGALHLHRPLLDPPVPQNDKNPATD